MKYAEVMRELKAMGTAQARKIYTRHGVSGKMYGMSYANLGKLKKENKVDHALAVKLWESDIHDARKLMPKWTRAKKEWIGRAGWHILSHIAMRDSIAPEEIFADSLQTIEANIHRSRNRVRDAMNNALIAIGLRNAKLERKAIAAAKRIGKVEVVHGETSCKTPDAIACIRKAKQNKRMRAH